MPQFEPASRNNTESVLSVSSLNKLAKSLLETNFPHVLVEGEISNLATPASGHWYFTLKDKNSQIRCAMFRNRNQVLRFKPRNGMQVMLRGRLSIYEGRGDYQLITDTMEEAGDGALRRAFEELKAKLHKEGLFDDEHKQEITQDYQHVGIVTSRTGAAVRDIITVFKRRFPSIRLTIFPVAVQGADAPAEIVQAIESANRLSGDLALDALIVGRGGGSLEDLQAFNEESVARAIFASVLPITSAVGHEVDFTIADFVADLRAPTPSAAAEIMSPDQGDYEELLEGYQQQLRQLFSGTLRQLQQSLGFIQRRLQRPDRRLQEHAQTLDRLEASLQRAMGNHIQLSLSQLQQQQRALFLSSPMTRIQNIQLQIQGQQRRYRQSIQTVIASSQSRLSELGRGLNAVNPLQVLARGFSITRNENGEILKASSTVSPGDRLISQLADGEVESIVKSSSSSSE